MARPRRTEHNRIALLDAGMQQLATQGYHGTGIKQVLDAVSVPKGSFYNYFDSKEGFVAALIDEYAERQLALFEQFVAQSNLSALGKLRAVNAHLLAQFEESDCQRGCLVGSLAAEIGSSSERCTAALERARSAFERGVAGLITAAQSAGELRQDQPADALAALYWATWEGALVRMRLEGRTEAARRIIDTALDLMKP
ncbi:TetR/AcrR family transcriptional repressor of nem operon [Inhella inkyongensis]|uniref:TetR/AcrR family transcriptional repressor of nem operon n=1 Tax=Inhella inkyongensis TaxID=392593 RepID=A0A840S340_9BURK|nr:TetR/AcrR family transcriptional regulator [Inhella inkyongensis]MBB5202990.1 TetR/AcrR family transcriptional repressor of nem operon [Inhella inkyongensis]